MTPHKTRIGIYPGTFDPITWGHMDIIERAAQFVDRLVIGVATNAGKNPLFDCETRVKMVQREVQRHGGDAKGNIKVAQFDSLLVNFAQEINASVIFRGLRNISDFGYEAPMAAMNRKMNQNIETLFLMAKPEMQHIASSLVKQVAALDGDVSAFVSTDVAADLKNYFNRTDSARGTRPKPAAAPG